MSKVDEIAALAERTSGTVAPGEVPAIDDAAERDAYAALAQRLYAGLEGPPEKRARSVRGQVATLLWQRVTEWDEQAEGD